MYVIPFKGLKVGNHNFNFEVNDEFFEKFEESEIKEGKFSVTVDIDKRATHLDLLIKITGTALINCDRCLEIFPYRISCENRLIAKLEEEDSGNGNADIIYYSADEYELDLGQHLYEFIHLALPIRRVHPVDKNGKAGCNPEMIKKLNELLIYDDKENDTDPVWDGLKKLINNKN